MNPKDIYNAWREQKSDIAVPPEFADRVMAQINTLEQNKPKRFYNANELLTRISFHPLAKTGLIAASVLIGLFRAALVVLMFLA